MSSPQGPLSPAVSESHGVKRKHDPDTDTDPTAASKPAVTSEIQLPSDPLRRASIINLATAAAAAVLQSQVTQRRTSTLPEQQEQKRQRVEQLGLLIQQARKASTGSLSLDITLETASHNAAIASVLANHLGLNPQASAAAIPLSGRSPSPSPTKAHASLLTLSATPATPKSPLSSEPLTAAEESHDAIAAQDAAVTSGEAVDKAVKVGISLQQAPDAAPSISTPVITLNSTAAAEHPSTSSTLPAEHHREWQSTVTGENFLDEAKEAAHSYSRFYRFEKEWAQKALELERRRSSIRVDPLFNPNPSLTPLTAEASRAPSEDKSRGPISPQQHSAPESRIVSRGTSPFADGSTGTSSRLARSVPTISFSSSQRGSSDGHGLANVLSNFAELIEHRQRSCSGLEELARQAKELPTKRFSQPDPHFRTTFGDFSWAKESNSGASPVTLASQTIHDGDGDSDASSVERDDDASVRSEAAGPLQSARQSHLQVKSGKKHQEGADGSDGDGPATPRSTMSIASML